MCGWQRCSTIITFQYLILPNYRHALCLGNAGQISQQVSKAAIRISGLQIHNHSQAETVALHGTDHRPPKYESFRTMSPNPIRRDSAFSGSSRFRDCWKCLRHKAKLCNQLVSFCRSSRQQFKEELPYYFGTLWTAESEHYINDYFCRKIQA